MIEKTARSKNILLTTVAITTLVLAIGVSSVALAGGNGNGNGNGNSANNRNENGNGNANRNRNREQSAPRNTVKNNHGAIASELGWRNAAHASENARLNANPNSAVGRLATFANATAAAAESEQPKP